MTLITAISDLHGQLPEALLPECDVLIIAGDVCPNFDDWPLDEGSCQARWLHDEFRPWLDAQKTNHVVVVWGNHDVIGEHKYAPLWLENYRWTLLTDEAVTLCGLKFYGMPWSLTFGSSRAFMADEPVLATKYDAIPSDTDILISHGPPCGYGDEAKNYGVMMHVGSPSLSSRIKTIRPALTVFGHIHSGNGFYRDTHKAFDGRGLMANASLVNEAYELVHEPMQFRIEHGEVISYMG